MDDGISYNFPPKQLLDKATADSRESRLTHIFSTLQEEEIDQPKDYYAGEPVHARSQARCPYCLSPACPGLYKPFLYTCVAAPEPGGQKRGEK